MARTFEKDGCNLTVRTYPELQNAVKNYAWMVAREKKLAGIPYEEGEAKGHAYVVNRILCWWLTLNDADRARIEEEGEGLFLRLAALPEGRIGALPFEQRAESVFQTSNIDERAEKSEDAPRVTRKSGGEVVRRQKPHRQRDAS